MDLLRDVALGHLRALTGLATADFHDDQWEAISALVRDRSRTLVVQRTGWGKSAVYFVATRLLRDQGAGPTLLVSPLLALMRNQVQAAERMGVHAATINSSNQPDWPRIVEDLQAGRVDLLLISPERFANAEFRTRVMPSIGAAAGLVVIDEAHCISDWGHDFRPDYRRIRRIVDLLPSNVPVLACTATANDRVVEDITTQLGQDLVVLRGPLARRGLSLQVIDLPTVPQRLAWLSEVIPTVEGTGIVYCLTTRAVSQVAGWLAHRGITVESYMGQTEGREDIEQRLLRNEVKAIVATSALGMGFDKPDLAYVVHFQSPGSAVTYYQQVGRAGRQLDRSLGVLLRGTEDRDIQDWFIDRAFPTEAEATVVVDALAARDGFVKLSELEQLVNVKRTRLELLLKNLEVDGVIVAEGRRYQRSATPWRYDVAHVERVTAARKAEQEQMAAYGGIDIGCRMAYLQALLDDPSPRPCGICDLCRDGALPRSITPDLAAVAADYVRRWPITITPRKQFPTHGRIPPEQQLSPGRALCSWGDGAWGTLVSEGKHTHQRFDQQLVDASAELVRDRWRPDPAPTWITFVPSNTHPALVRDFAGRLGEALGLPVHDVVRKVRDTPAQKGRQNSAQQYANVADAFGLAESLPTGPVLLVDDIVDSRWTLTAVGRLLRLAGVQAVLPLALADAGAS